MISRRWMMAGMGAVPWAAGPAFAAARPDPPTLAELLRPPAVRDATLSPDGRQVAVLQEGYDGDRRIAYVTLVAAEAPSAPPRRVVLGDFEVDAIHWANDERLLISIFVERDEDYVPTGSHRTFKLNTSFRRMMSVGLDGNDPVLLFGDQPHVLRSNFDLGRLVDLLPDDHDHILMRLRDPWTRTVVLHRVNVLTGGSELVERGSDGTATWFVQNGQPMLRLDFSFRGSTASLYARSPGADDWRFVRKFVMRREIWRPDLDIVAATEEAGVFLVVHQDDQAPTAALKKLDIRDFSFREVVAARPDRHVAGALVDDRGRFVAAHYVDDRVVYDFADERLDAHFRGIDAFLKKSANIRIKSVDRDRNRMLVRASSPTLPAAYYLYDVGARRVTPLAVGRPWLSAERLAPMESLDVHTRDGTSFRAYLTVPAADGPRPLLVMPHGGPEVRDQWDFDLFAQAFAAQGWLVLQPNFRGSGGYGRAFAEAGRRRWGDRMQEDVEDAVAQVLASGRADPQRVAICGASYGGYAALMGAVRRPNLYRAAVSIAGVSDLPEILESERHDGEDAAVYQYWVRTIGDPETEMERLVAASPRRRAKEIRAPVLLIHGLDDVVVRPDQSRMMAGALKAAGKAVDHVELRDVGHGGWEPKTTATVLERSIAFIAKAFA